MSGARGLLACGVVLGAISIPRPAIAEPPWVDRHVTLPERDWAFDVGLGVAHDSAQPSSPTGPGLNVEGAVAPLDGFEVGVRTGIRMGTDARMTRADDYGRLFDRQTFGTNNDTVANPEIRARGAVLRGAAAEIALEGRIFVPIEGGSEFGVMLGIPVLFHIAHLARIDAGVYAPVTYTAQLDMYFSVPVDLWVQATDRLWLGPMSGFVFRSVNNEVSVPLGFGGGYQILPAVDLKAQLLFPAVNETHGGESFGVGVGVQVRIE